MVVSQGSTRLAVFFGRQRANDVLLSHMITFLNDKTDSQLRFCFHDNIAGVASLVGWQCSPILRPLLEQVSGGGSRRSGSRSCLMTARAWETPRSS